MLVGLLYAVCCRYRCSQRQLIKRLTKMRLKKTEDLAKQVLDEIGVGVASQVRFRSANEVVSDFFLPQV